MERDSTKEAGLLSQRKHYHYYKEEFGGTQKELITLYLKLGKTPKEIKQILNFVPDASIRRVRHETGL